MKRFIPVLLVFLLSAPAMAKETLADTLAAQCEAVMHFGISSMRAFFDAMTEFGCQRLRPSSAPLACEDIN
ncbi:MAG: hypothetical protein ACO3RT_00180 [Arenicellales bacterium]|jgi:hypothetical protein